MMRVVLNVCPDHGRTDETAQTTDEVFAKWGRFTARGSERGQGRFDRSSTFERMVMRVMRVVMRVVSGLRNALTCGDEGDEGDEGGLDFTYGCVCGCARYARKRDNGENPSSPSSPSSVVLAGDRSRSRNWTVAEPQQPGPQPRHSPSRHGESPSRILDR